MAGSQEPGLKTGLGALHRERCGDIGPGGLARGDGRRPGELDPGCAGGVRDLDDAEGTRAGGSYRGQAAGSQQRVGQVPQFLIGETFGGCPDGHRAFERARIVINTK